MQLSLKIPGSSNEPSQTLVSPSGIPSTLTGDISNTGAVLFQTGISWLLYIATTLAIIMLMWGGIQWITSSGDPEKLSSAKRKLTFAIIGLVISLSAFFIVRVVITILGGDAGNLLNPTKFFTPTNP